MIKKYHHNILLFALIAVFSLGFVSLMTHDAFADTIDISSWVANDPDDGDTTYSAGDTLTLTFSGNTNATNGGTMTHAEVIANFTFTTPNIATGATFSGLWTSLSTLQITVDTAGTAATIGGTTVQGALPADGRIGTVLDGQNNGLDGTHGLTATASSALTGDFGLFVAAATNNGGGGCTGDCEEPTLGVNNDGRRLVDDGFTYNDKSIDVERYFTPYPLVTVQVGKQNVAEFKIYDNSGLDKISHFELAFGLAQGESIGMSQAVINWDRTFDGIETVTLDDPEHVLDNVKIITSEGYCSDESQTKCLIVKITHTFRAPLDFNILGTNVWDAKRNAWQNYYNHGIEVVGPSMNPPKEHDGINKGHIYHLTETGKNTAVDDFGNSWSLDHGLWIMDYVAPEKIQDTSSIMTRTHSEFAKYKSTQADNAISYLLELCPSCLNPYADFEDSFNLDYPKRMDKMSNPAIQKLLSDEAILAEEKLLQLFEQIYPNMVFD
jgi:hypothetical protein